MADIDVDKTPPAPVRLGTAKKFVELVKDQKKSPEEAARILSLDLSTAGASEQMRLYTQKLLRSWAAGPDVRRELVRAGLNKIFMESLASGDYKTALDATKQIGSDPDVGLNAAPQPIVNINIEAIEGIVSKMKPSDVIDAEVTDGN